VAPDVRVCVKPASAAQRAHELAGELHQTHSQEVLTASVITRDQALKTLKSNPSWSDALAVLPSNPLPDAIVVTLRDLPGLAQQAPALAGQWRQMDGVESVQLDSEWVRRHEAILQDRKSVV